MELNSVKQNELMELRLKHQKDAYQEKIDKLETELTDTKQSKKLEASVIERINKFKIKNAKSRIKKLEKVIEAIRITMDTDSE